MTLSVTLLTGCVKEDDFAIPTLKPVLFLENFEDKTISQYVIEIEKTGKVLSLKDFDITI